MTGRYARDTVVSVEKSKAEIERILMGYGAASFSYAGTRTHSMILFEIGARHVQIILPLPHATDKTMTHDGRNSERSPMQLEEAITRETRRRWRSLALMVKAKLEAVASGIALLEDEFLPYIVMPDGQTVGKWIRPQLEQAYTTHRMPPLIPALASGKR